MIKQYCIYSTLYLFPQFLEDTSLQASSVFPVQFLLHLLRFHCYIVVCYFYKIVSYYILIKCLYSKNIIFSYFLTLDFPQQILRLY